MYVDSTNKGIFAILLYAFFTLKNFTTRFFFHIYAIYSKATYNYEHYSARLLPAVDDSSLFTGINSTSYLEIIR